MKSIRHLPDGTDIALAPSLDRVARGDLCAGCGGCQAIAPDAVVMTPSPDGYARPVQIAPLTPDQDAAIAAICPGLGQSVDSAGRSSDTLFGPYLRAWTGWAKDDAARFAGASGGGLTAIACHLLDTGRVDGVVHIAADPASPMGNRTVISTTVSDVVANAGSRYAPSSPLTAVPRLVADGRRFAVICKPCDASALAAIRARDPKVQQAVPVILSFFCAGIPSSEGAQGILQSLEVSPDDLASFRYRGNGWPGRATASLKDGTDRSMTYHDSWGGILSKHVQHRCKICADGTGMAADLVCADAWESDEAGYPVFDEQPGVSLIMARTKLGEEIALEARAADRIELQAFDMGTLAAIQPGQRERRRALFARLLALRLIGRPVPDYRGLQLGAASRQNPLLRNVKNFLGTLRRALRA